MFVHRNTFHYAPNQSIAGNEVLPGLNFLYRPDFAVGDVVQGMYNVCNTGLTDEIKGDRVVGAVPAPTFAH